MYTPQNPQVFTAAYAGALAGLVLAGRLSTSDPSVYVAQAELAGVYAQAIDTEWGVATAKSLEIQLIQSGSEAAWAGSGAELGQGSVSATAQVVIAVLLAAQDYYTANGLPDPDFGGGGSGTSLVYSYPDVPTIAASDVTAIPDQALATVGVINDSYRLFKAPSSAVVAAADGVNIIAVTAPVGQHWVWIRLYLENQSAWYVPLWNVSTTGNDGNDGVINPLKSLQEVSNRLRGAILPQSVTVQLGAGSFGGAFFDVRFVDSLDGGVFLVLGTLSSTAPIVGTYTAEVPTTLTRGTIAAADTFVDRTRLRIISGTGTNGFMAFVTRVVSAGNANVTTWQRISNVPFGTTNDVGNPNNGDTYVVDTLLTTVAGLRMTCKAAMRARVVCQDCVVSIPTVGGVSYGAHIMTGPDGPELGLGALVYRCTFDDSPSAGLTGAFLNSDVFTTCCNHFSQMVVQNSFMSIAGNVYYNLLSPFGPGSEIAMRTSCCWDGGTISVQNGAYFSTSAGTSMQFCDGVSPTAISIAGTFMLPSCLPWGANVTFTTAFQVTAAQNCLYTTAQLPTIPATTNQCLIGGVSKHYTDLPYINPANNAAMVINA